MGLFRNTLSTTLAWCRPTHRSTCCAYITGGNTCCICVPSTATCFVIEMWGQGGGGAGSCCCQWSPHGGQGGDYGWVVCTTSGTNHILCACACQCCCLSCQQCGHPGQFSRVTQCNAPSCIWCVQGGTSGCSNCCYTTMAMMNNQCGSSWECNSAHSLCAWSCGCLPLSSSMCYNWQNTSCLICSRFTYCGQGPFQPVQGTTINQGGGCAGGVCGCACFNFYVRGACGWTDPMIFYQLTGCDGSFCGPFTGRGGAAYAGGRDQFCDCSYGSFTYQGMQGFFPGGGASSAGACGGGCCIGGVGGDGLILISWS